MGLIREEPGWLAFAKAPGQVVVPARGEDPDGSLWRRLEASRGERLWVVHRLDRDTSGVVVFARSAEDHRALSGLFEQARVLKEYLAFTRGVPAISDIRVALIDDGRDGTRVASDGERGKASRTVVEVLRRYAHPDGPIALVRCRPSSGRRHQIRVHLASVGAPLLVDLAYGAGPTALPIDRLTLHAHRLELPAPYAADLVCPMPPDFVALQRHLERTAAIGAR